MQLSEADVTSMVIGILGLWCGYKAYQHFVTTREVNICPVIDRNLDNDQNKKHTYVLHRDLLPAIGYGSLSGILLLSTVAILNN